MRGIEFEIVWSDQHAVQYRVVCSNGSFCGAAKIYLAHGALSAAAEDLNGFPSGPADSRNVRFGAVELNTAGGSVDMAFRCVDSVGHAVVLVKLTAEGRRGIGEPQSVCLHVPVEAGSIDSFVAKARSVDETKGAKAYLHMADHTVDWVQRSFPNL